MVLKFVKNKKEDNHYECVCDYTNDLTFEQLDVEQSDVDGKWYLPVECPHKQLDEKLLELKKEKHTENTTKAKQAVENGHVLFKNAEFETNAQTVGDLTATMLLMQAGGVETYSWLSKDDKVVELTLEDFGTLGGLIAEYKNTIWQEKYINFKTRIEQADTLSELEEIEIEY